jgi:CheY-like chemotaxis protein
MSEEARRKTNLQSLKGSKVLVVEDSWHLATALKSFLESFGSVVLGPTSSLDGALELLGKERPKLAIVDMNLKGELADRLLDQLQKDEVPFIVVTGYSNLPSVLKDSIVVKKPFTPNDLLEALERMPGL